jgi:hypothetical protein
MGENRIQAPVVSIHENTNHGRAGVVAFIFFINITGKHPAAVAEACESRRPEETAYGCS